MSDVGMQPAAGGYPLWHGQLRMSEQIARSDPENWLVRGEGCSVMDRAGRRYLDARAGVCNVQLGYGRADIAEAMYRQALDLAYGCVIRFSRPAAATMAYAERLVAVAPPGMTRVRLTHMGSASIENALLIARLYHRNLGEGGRIVTVSLGDGYHGTSYMTMAASAEERLAELYGPFPEEFRRIRRPDRKQCLESAAGQSSDLCYDSLLEELSTIGFDRIAAVIMEPVMGNRAYPLPAHYLQTMRQICTDNGILLVFDEIVTGFGRTGPMFAADHYGVVPDMLCLAKGITSGYAPLGAVLVREEVYAAFDIPGKPFFANGSSTDGHPVSCAAGLAVLDAFERERICDAVPGKGERLLDRVRMQLAGHPWVTDIRGVGLIVGIELRPDGALPSVLQMRAIEKACEERGVLVQYAYDTVVLYPPLVIDSADIDLLAEVVCSVLWESIGDKTPSATE